MNGGFLGQKSAAREGTNLYLQIAECLLPKAFYSGQQYRANREIIEMTPPRKILNFHGALEEIVLRLREEFGGDYPETLPVHAREMKERRKKLHLTQQDVSNRSGVSQSVIVSMEKYPENQFDTERIYSISTVLDWDFDLVAKVPAIHGIRLNALLERIKPRIRRLSEVATLVSPLRGTAVTDSYYPRQLQLLDSGNLVPAEETFRTLRNGPSLIRAAAGAGKSLILRRLMWECFQDRSQLPLYVELRTLKGRSIQETVLALLKKLKPEFDDELMDLALHHNRLYLLLDGLDEVSTKDQEEIASELEQYYDDTPEVSMTVASRPFPGIEDMHWIKEYTIKPLDTPSEVLGFISCYVNKDFVAKLRPFVQGWDFRAKQTFSSPRIILLWIHHLSTKAWSSENLFDFYVDLPRLLLQENSFNGKPKRAVLSNLEPDELAYFFSALCYSWIEKCVESVVPRHDLLAISTDALKYSGIKVSPGRVVNDIINLTNFISKSGRFYEFPQSQVKDANAAAFLRSLEDGDALSFYERMRSTWKKWISCLSILAEIDGNRLRECVLLPDIIDAMKLTIVDFVATCTELSATSCGDGYELEISGSDRLSFNGHSLSLGIVTRNELQHLFQVEGPEFTEVDRKGFATWQIEILPNGTRVIAWSTTNLVQFAHERSLVDQLVMRQWHELQQNLKYNLHFLQSGDILETLQHLNLVGMS